MAGRGNGESLARSEGTAKEVPRGGEAMKGRRCAAQHRWSAWRRFRWRRDPELESAATMRGIGGAAARRGAHLPSYAAAFSSFSSIGRGGGGAGRGRGSGSSPSPFGQQPRAPGRPIPDDDGADPFSAPASVGRGRGEPVVPSSPTIPSFSAFSGTGRGSPPPPPPAAEDTPKQHVTKRPEDASLASDPERPSRDASSSALPRSIPSAGAGRGVPRFQQPPADNAPEENRFIRCREAKQAAASSSAPSTQPKLSAEDAVKRALELLGGGEDAVRFAEKSNLDVLMRFLITFVPLFVQIEFEPEYHVNFDNPDIDEKPPMSLEEMLQKVKPFIVAYEGIKDQEEWEEAVKDVMTRAPHMKELIDMYSGPDVVTAKQQEEELQRVANTLPENIPSSVNRFTDKILLSLKNNPGWSFDKKCQFMDKFAREVSELYK